MECQLIYEVLHSADDIFADSVRTSNVITTAHDECSINVNSISCSSEKWMGYYIIMCVMITMMEAKNECIQFSMELTKREHCQPTKYHPAITIESKRTFNTRL